MREIKFRAWDNKLNKILEWTDIAYNDGPFFHEDTDYELMQFTGLYDKNGKEIYEGDILKRPDLEINYIVVFNGGCFCIQDSKNKHHNLKLLDGISIFLGIIGNIYENPELLKEKRMTFNILENFSGLLGKQYLFLQDDDTYYNRYTDEYMTEEEAVDWLYSELSEVINGGE